jgi:hypothetical protein
MGVGRLQVARELALLPFQIQTWTRVLKNPLPEDAELVAVERHPTHFILFVRSREFDPLQVIEPPVYETRSELERPSTDEPEPTESVREEGQK